MNTVWLLISPVCGVHELGGDEERRVVGLVALLAGLDRLASLLEAVVAERQRHRAAEVLDRGDLLEDLLEPGAVGDVGAALGLGRGDAGLPALVAEQPVEALRLERQEVGDLQWFANLRERQTARRGLCGGHVLSRYARQPRRVLPRAFFESSDPRCRMAPLAGPEVMPNAEWHWGVA